MYYSNEHGSRKELGMEYSVDHHTVPIAVNTSHIDDDEAELVSAN